MVERRFTPELTQHPTDRRFQLLLSRWKEAYKNKERYHTPQDMEAFDQADKELKMVNLVIEQVLDHKALLVRVEEASTAD